MSKTPVERIILYAALAGLLFLELTVFNGLRVFGVRPELLLIATLFFGLYFGPAGGIEAGIASGILKDVFTIGAFGINTFSFFLIGFLSGYFKGKLVKENFFARTLLSAMSVCLISGIHFLYLGKILKADMSAASWGAVLCKGLYTGIAAPAVFFILGKIFKSALHRKTI